MREGMFIKKNVDKWNRYQHDGNTDPDETAERFISLVDDLSYAKTFYPQSKVTGWINGLAAGTYLNIYRNKKEKYSRVFHFWKFELPLLFRRYHRVFLFTFLVFVCFVSIGVFSAIKEENFLRQVLTDQYVDMTERNINNGDPFGVYRDDNPFTMFVTIAINNTSIAFFMAIGGLLFGTVTLFFMWKNGLMLGCFQYLFFSKGLGFQSVMVIWIHGTLEIAALIISSTAGFIIAESILFPGTFSRLQSFRRGIKDALKVMVVLVPIFILAAFFESYVTHLMSETYGRGRNGLPVGVSAIILAGSLAFLCWYFIIYPIRLHRRLSGQADAPTIS